MRLLLLLQWYVNVKPEKVFIMQFTKNVETFHSIHQKIVAPELNFIYDELNCSGFTFGQFLFCILSLSHSVHYETLSAYEETTIRKKAPSNK